MAMISQGVQDALNEQINHELFSAYIYLSMSAYFEHANLLGFAKWMRAQAQEEVNHGMKLFDFVNDRGGRVLLKQIDNPPTEFKSPLEVFEHALKHEQAVTGMINKLYEVAAKANDFATQVALQWFITEQVEEENSADIIVEQLKMIGNDRSALLMMDRELGARQPGAED
ncbi:MAG TPA: ferritin [Longimicrobiales bacterium]|nr:ferritin [Longimicrobiales bacterium]